MMQGDSYGIVIDIIKADGVAVTDADVSDVEIVIGSLVKTYANDEVKFHEGKWVFPLSQEESFKMPSGYVKAQVRVEFADGNVEGVPLGDIRVHESISKVVL